tara:strand:+ start:416 stop:607 length:192 start_codon:yes stop_codon:yes gene_type:complete
MKFKSGDLCIAVNPLVLSFSEYALVIERIYRCSSGSTKKGEYAYRCLINNDKKVLSECNLRKI